MKTLPWKTAWVVGASSGIGRATARRLAASGVRVAASSRSRPELSALADEGRGGIAAYPLDVTDRDGLLQAVPAIDDELGPIDLVVLSAGIWEPFEPDSFDPAAFSANMEVNYLGAVNAIAAVLPAFRARGSGQIAIVASVAGYVGLPKAATYGPTKAALINLAECLRCELDGSGVTVCVVNPGFVETRLTAKNDFPMPFLMSAEEAADRMIRGLATGRFEVAFPRRLTWLMKLARLLPYPVYFPGIRTFVAR
ncbi:SDR family NAD(P)-dependent oxidoreductase [Microbaculum marinum]|uniref:SDR family NAD(P)-dependent oxidoreductase n=1 Tax=Microbaculum marinum TaxID=1764581 RepID=A0AAW9RSL3_9HYPH